MLEERVRLLEQQLKQLEGRLERRDAAVPRRRDVRADSTRDPQRPVMPGRSPDTDPSQPPIVASATPDRPPHPPQPPSLGVGNPTDAPQETFVFRENSVTLPPWRFETSTAFGYVRGNGFLQTDRAATNTTALRLGILNWLELNATIPSFVASRTRSVAPFRTTTRQTEGLGDILIKANARVYEQTTSAPGIVLSLGVVLPTGLSPYDFRRYQPDPSAPGYNPNPTNLDAAYFSRGAWGTLIHLEFYKTVDPVILFFGAGTKYLFPQAASGHRVQGGVTYDYNLGFSLALSEKSTLGFQVEGAYQSNLTVDGHRVPQTGIEPVAARMSLVQRIFANTWIEPSISIGLTNNTPGVTLDVGLRHRF